jgi:TPR repeat protein
MRGRCLRVPEKLADDGKTKRSARSKAGKAVSKMPSLYRFGEGVPKDSPAAAKWSHKAAEQGNVQAQNDLADMYLSGEGVLKDYAEAAIWFRKASNQGNALAQSSLGLTYREGKGVPQDYSEAIKLFRMAATSGGGHLEGAIAEYVLGDMYAAAKAGPRTIRRRHMVSQSRQVGLPQSAGQTRKNVRDGSKSGKRQSAG